MQSLVTPLVGVIQNDSSYLFSRKQNSDGKTVFGVTKTDLPGLIAKRPGTLFESGTRWQMVPTKLYRFEDKNLYLKQKYPLVPVEHIGVTAVPELEAMAIFNRNPDIPESLYSGNHIAELFIHVSTKLKSIDSDHALVFFLQNYCWMVLMRKGEIVLAQAEYYKIDEDAVFHIAAVLETYGMNREQTPVYIAGLISETGQLYRKLKIYFDIRKVDKVLSNIEPSSPTEFLLAYHSSLQNQPIHLGQ